MTNKGLKHKFVEEVRLMGLLGMFRHAVLRQPKASAPKRGTTSSGIGVTFTITTDIRPSSTEAEIIPADIRARTTTMSKQGLFPHEILVLDYAHTFYTSDNSFQGFWWYRYGVRDVQSVLSSLAERGFLETGDIRAVLNMQTVAELKAILELHGISTRGRKTDLVQRVLDSIPDQEFNSRFPRRTYALTEAGRRALDEAAYVSYIHRHPIEDLDIWSLNRLIYSEPYMSYRDKIWRHLNQLSIRRFSERNFGLYANCRLTMATFLKEEGKLKDALAMLAEVAFYDLTGAINNYDPKFLEIYAESFFPYQQSLATVAPGVIAEIANIQKELRYSDEELKASLVERMHKLSAPVKVFTVEECIQIVLMERDKDTEGLVKVYSRASKTFAQKYPGARFGR